MGKSLKEALHLIVGHTESGFDMNFGNTLRVVNERAEVINDLGPSFNSTIIENDGKEIRNFFLNFLSCKSALNQINHLTGKQARISKQLRKLRSLDDGGDILQSLQNSLAFLDRCVTIFKRLEQPLCIRPRYCRNLCHD